MGTPLSHYSLSPIISYTIWEKGLAQHYLQTPLFNPHSPSQLRGSEATGKYVEKFRVDQYGRELGQG